jgi:hypothetical protein
MVETKDLQAFKIALEEMEDQMAKLREMLLDSNKAAEWEALEATLLQQI